MSKTETHLTRFAKLQAELPVIKPDSKNPHFKSDYASLEAIQAAVLPLVSAAGFCLVFSMIEGNVVGTVFCDDTEVATGSFPIPDTPNPQAIGSHLTYAKRYLTALLLNVKISGDDDDGNAAAGDKSVKAKPRKASAKAIKDLTELALGYEADVPGICEFYKVERLEDLTGEQVRDCRNALNQKYGDTGV